MENVIVKITARNVHDLLKGYRQPLSKKNPLAKINLNIELKLNGRYTDLKREYIISGIRKTQNAN